MSYLLDTCAISETIAKKPNLGLIDWLENQNETSLYLSVLTIGEIRKGIYQLDHGKRRVILETWLNDQLWPVFGGRILDIDEALIDVWARLVADLKAAHITRPAFDSVLEATAIRHNLIFVTRNERDFKDSSVSILNPWT
jgi:predicted nucleic acid-binding protein